MQQTFKPLYTSKSGGALHYVCYCTVLLVGQNAQIIVFLLVGSLIGVTSNWCPGLTCSSSWWTIATRSPTMPSHVESSIFTQSSRRVWNDFTQRTRFVNAFPGSEWLELCVFRSLDTFSLRECSSPRLKWRRKSFLFSSTSTWGNWIKVVIEWIWTYFEIIELATAINELKIS